MSGTVEATPRRGVDAPVAGIPPPPGPFLTVLVTAYRRKNYLRAAVQSVLEQTIPRDQVEIVVFKDFADPDLDAWLGSLGPSVRTVTEDLPLIGQMLVRGLELAHGSVVCFLEDDDRFRPTKLENIAELFRGDPGLGYVRNSYDAIDAQGTPMPSWEGFRPQPPRTVTWGPGRERVSIPWLYRYGGYINLSTMSLRTSVGRRWAPWLRRLPASSDVVLFILALASDVAVRIDSNRWNEYRVHPSTSHPVLASGNEALDLRDVQRSLAAAEVLRAALTQTQVPANRVSRLIGESFRLESVVVEFLLDRAGHLSFNDWLRFAPWFARRRQPYLASLWFYCIYRWLLPERAVLAYRARRHGDLRRSAVPETSPGGTP
jgi:hypothetical protein